MQRPSLHVVAGLCGLVIQSAQASPAPVEPDAAMQAYHEVAQVQSAWSQEAAEKLVDPAEITGVCLTLRERGKVIGRAEVMADDGTALRQAMLQVMKQAAPPREIEGVGPMPRTIDLQFAGPLIPLAGDSFAAASAFVSPGREGVAARVGDRLGAAFPAVMLVTDSSAARGLRIACARAGAPPMNLAQLREQVDVRIYRFDVVHLAQPSAARAPMFLHRGGRLIEETSVNTRSIRAFAHDAAAHLLASRWPGDEPFGLMGPYRAARDEHAPFIEAPYAQALGALALARYARTAGVDATHAALALRSAWEVLADVAVAQPPELDPMGDVAALGLWLAALAEVRAQELPMGIAAHEIEAFEAQARTACIDAVAGAEAVDRDAMITRALVAYGLARAGETELAQAEVDRLFETTPPGQLVSLMPWLGWAALACADGEAKMKSAAALEVLRDVVWQHQVLATDAGEERDLIGGIVFTRGRSANGGLPTWHSVKPLALLATMLGDARFTDEVRFVEDLPRVARGMRFLMQLAAGEAEGHMYPRPARATGGVRRALWDQTVTIDATALALLAACEVLESVKKLRPE